MSQYNSQEKLLGEIPPPSGAGALDHVGAMMDEVNQERLNKSTVKPYSASLIANTGEAELVEAQYLTECDKRSELLDEEAKKQYRGSRKPSSQNEIQLKSEAKQLDQVWSNIEDSGPNQAGVNPPAVLNYVSVSSNETADNDKVLSRLKGADGIDQGEFGDCAFEATLAGLAASKNGPKIIANMIQEHADGSYTVTFPGDKNQPVTLSKKELGGIVGEHFLSNSAEWANIIEAAAIKLKGNDLSGTLVGGPVIELLTGRHADTDYIFHGSDSSNAQSIAQHISQTLEAGGVAIASSKHHSPGLVGWHYYSVLGYDKDTQTVTLRNPWGSTDWDTDVASVGDTKGGITDVGAGEIKMSLSTFMDDFDEVSYQGKPLSPMQTIGRDASFMAHGIIDLPNFIGDLIP